MRIKNQFRVVQFLGQSAYRSRSSVHALSLRSAGSEEENSGAVYSVDVDIPFILLHKDWEHDGYCSRTKLLHHTVNAT